MAKIHGEWGKDNFGRDCIILEKKKGWINQREVFEWLEENRKCGMSFVHMADCPEETPEDLYEEGDKWFLYEPEVILEELATRASWNTGYNYTVTKK